MAQYWIAISSLHCWLGKKALLDIDDMNVSRQDVTQDCLLCSLTFTKRYRVREKSPNIFYQLTASRANTKKLELFFQQVVQAPRLFDNPKSKILAG